MHEYKFKSGHNSESVSNKRDGHKIKATHDNIMGGKTWNKGWDDRQCGVKSVIENNRNDLCKKDGLLLLLWNPRQLIFDLFETI